ncbi:MAG TPA: DMT family transporter [Thermoanaerobaculia bacterium]|nr:DMT family transporter [Thermoanaerobaculia bacterium]
MRHRTATEACIALVLFGCIPVVVRSVSANAFTIGIFRLTVATLGLGAMMFFRRELRRVPVRDLARLAVIGLLFAAHWLTLFLGVKASSASIGAIGLSTYGAHLLVLGALFGAAHIRAADVIAVAIAAFGAVLVVPSFTLADDVALGMLLSSVSALLYASLPLLHQRWSHIDNSTRALGQFAFALAFFLLFLGKADWALAPRDWGGLLFLAIGVTLIGHSLWVRVTTRLSPPVTSIIYYANIPVAIALGAILLGERLTLRSAIGAALIIGASVLGLARRAGRGVA